MVKNDEHKRQNAKIVIPHYFRTERYRTNEVQYFRTFYQCLAYLHGKPLLPYSCYPGGEIQKEEEQGSSSECSWNAALEGREKSEAGALSANTRLNLVGLRLS